MAGARRREPVARYLPKPTPIDQAEQTKYSSLKGHSPRA